MKPLEVGSPAPRIDRPAADGRFDSETCRGAPLVVEFIRGTW